MQPTQNGNDISNSRSFEVLYYRPMTDRLFRCAFVLLALGFLLLASVWVWSRIDIGRYSYGLFEEKLLMFDSKSGTMYILLDRGPAVVWREIRPRTGQALDRSYRKIN